MDELKQELERMNRRAAYLESEITRIDLDYWDDVETRFDREQDRLSECTCGAWQYSKERGEFVMVADCYCGIA